MKYTKENVLQEAQKRGSSAKTIAGAIKYLNAHLNQIEKIGNWRQRTSGYRNAEGKKQYIESKLHNRAQQFCDVLGLKTREEQIEITQKRDHTRLRKIKEYLEDHYPYRVSQSHWAGGDHFITVKFATDKPPSAEGYSTREWSSNGKWSGNDSHAHFFITRRTLRYFPNAMTPDGLVVLDAKKIGKREYQIVWAEQSRGFDLKTIEGFLIRGYHVKGNNVEKARKRAKQARNRALETRIKERDRAQKDRDWKQKLAYVWVGVPDSLQAGNCEAATKTYLNKLKSEIGNIGGIRADYLLSLRDDIYSRRAVSKAAERYVS